MTSNVGPPSETPMIATRLSRPDDFVDELVDDSDHRGQGIGSRLLIELMAQARQRECSRIELDSACHRKDVHRFYQRHGFENRACHFSKPL
jgi:GNAT superfamily N-acetyltransferase